MFRMIAFAALAVSALPLSPAAAEPVENGSEVAQLLASLGDRCWAVDAGGTMLDAAALADVAGPVDIELECIVEDPKAPTARPLPTNVI